jgi:putative Holliday junction resolvase
MVVMALDVGQARIGVAVSDPTGLLASPYAVIPRRSTSQAIAAITRACAETGAERLVIGLPISLDGELHSQARAVQTFGGRLVRTLALPVVYCDERYSTLAAQEALRAAGVRRSRAKAREDAVAAAVILQRYLDDQRAQQHDLAPEASRQDPEVGHDPDGES